MSELVKYRDASGDSAPETAKKSYEEAIEEAMTQAQELWAIKSPDGEIDALSVHFTEQAAWVTYLQAPYKYSQMIALVDDHKAKGYRAVRVRVEEIEEIGSEKE